MKDRIKSVLARIPSFQYRNSYAKDELDKRLDPFIGRRGGFFLEAGANDGINQSNTLYFETYSGWTGILVEPVPRLAGLCRRNRPRCQVEAVALAARAGGEPVKLIEAGLMTTTVGAFAGTQGDYSQTRHLTRAAQFLGKQPEDLPEVEAATKTLSQIIDENHAPEIDLLSLDVEGYEYEALQGLDLARHRPRFILIEERNGVSYESMLGSHYRKEAVLAYSEFYQDTLYRSIN